MRQKIERIVQTERTVAQRKAPAGLTTPLAAKSIPISATIRAAGAGRDRRSGHHHPR
jgi:hypothetical protein